MITKTYEITPAFTQTERERFGGPGAIEIKDLRQDRDDQAGRIAVTMKWDGPGAAEDNEHVMFFGASELQELSSVCNLLLGSFDREDLVTVNGPDELG